MPKLDLTDEEFQLLWDRDPYNPKYIEHACQDALYRVYIPTKTGTWPKYDVRVYYDDGPMGSGYLMVHWDDSKKVPGCLSNGYCTDPDLRSDNVEWDDQPQRERALSVRQTLREWAY